MRPPIFGWHFFRLPFSLSLFILLTITSKNRGRILGTSASLDVRTSGQSLVCRSTVLSHIGVGEALVVAQAAGREARDRVYIFNGSGSELWAMLLAGHSIADMAEHLVAEYGLSCAQAHADADQFVLRLVEAGLITRN
jgi:hypothetical protein